MTDCFGDLLFCCAVTDCFKHFTIWWRFTNCKKFGDGSLQWRIISVTDYFSDHLYGRAHYATPLRFFWKVVSRVSFWRRIRIWSYFFDLRHIYQDMSTFTAEMSTLPTKKMQQKKRFKAFSGSLITNLALVFRSEASVLRYINFTKIWKNRSFYFIIFRLFIRSVRSRLCFAKPSAHLGCCTTYVCLSEDVRPGLVAIYFQYWSKKWWNKVK